MIGLLMMLAAGPQFALTQLQADAISRRCHSPSHWIKVHRDKSVHFKPSRTAAYAKIDCVLIAFRKRDGPMARVGFITND